jgi:hypothetical protein
LGEGQFEGHVFEWGKFLGELWGNLVQTEIMRHRELLVLVWLQTSPVCQQIIIAYGR